MRRLSHLLAFLSGVAVVLTAGRSSAQSCALPASGLVSCWAAEGDARDAIDGNHGVLTNGATLAPGVVGQGFRLDGTDDLIELGTPASLMPTTTEFTVLGWFLVPDYPRNGGFHPSCASYYPIIAFDWGWSVGVAETGRVSFGEYISAIVGTGVGSACPISTNAFHHFAAVHASSELRIYVDGQIAGVAPASAARSVYYHPGDTLQIGRRDCGGGHWNYKGQLDELAFYDRALSDAEIEAIVRAVQVAPGDGGVACDAGIWRDARPADAFEADSEAPDAGAGFEDAAFLDTGAATETDAGIAPGDATPGDVLLVQDAGDSDTGAREDASAAAPDAEAPADAAAPDAEAPADAAAPDAEAPADAATSARDGASADAATSTRDGAPADAAASTLDGAAADAAPRNDAAFVGGDAVAADALPIEETPETGCGCQAVPHERADAWGTLIVALMLVVLLRARRLTDSRRLFSASEK